MKKPEDFKILVACEESQAVTIEFRKRGFKAFSCDIQDCSGGYPEWHFKQDIFKVTECGIVLNQSGQWIEIDKWDMMIAFPPCTHLAVSGAAWFEEKRKDGRQQEAIEFVKALMLAPIEKIAIENLKRIADATGRAVSGTSPIKGRVLRVLVGVQKNDADRTEIKKYLPADKVDVPF